MHGKAGITTIKCKRVFQGYQVWPKLNGSIHGREFLALLTTHSSRVPPAVHPLLRIIWFQTGGRPAYTRLRTSWKGANQKHHARCHWGETPFWAFGRWHWAAYVRSIAMVTYRRLRKVCKNLQTVASVLLFVSGPIVWAPAWPCLPFRRAAQLASCSVIKRSHWVWAAGWISGLLSSSSMRLIAADKSAGGLCQTRRQWSRMRTKASLTHLVASRWFKVAENKPRNAGRWNDLYNPCIIYNRNARRTAFMAPVL